ncbi:hypothetical protein EPUL_004045 [Erysiphe pulchra]|uniref:RNase H type-1 domain-containing protein n=1 Tax=Erysiphe pulchra TaxID=225359 RepID=A0A2S4PVY4_9PEZI|nr:hypothetical protein EPUL_004045 [Erysiphe pulchra]
MANQSTQWLDIWLDRKLFFLNHATKWAVKAVSVSGFLRRLNNSQRGSSPQLVRQAIKAYIIPIALYRAEFWYPGTTDFAWRNGKQVSGINRAVISGLRAFLPVSKTVTLPTLYREPGILSAIELLKHDRTHQALRIQSLQSLDELRPLKQRALEQIALLRRNQSAHRSIILNYTHGSCQSLDSTRGGYIAYQSDHKIISGNFRSHDFAAAMDAEITAIAEGVESINRNFPIHLARNLIVYSHNKTAVDIYYGRIPLSSQVQALRIYQLQRDRLLRRRLPHIALGTVVCEWILWHSNNLGNDEVDRLVKLWSKLSVPSIHGYIYTASKEIVRTLITNYSEE